MCAVGHAAALEWLGVAVPHHLGPLWRNLYPAGPQPEGLLTDLAPRAACAEITAQSPHML